MKLWSELLTVFLTFSLYWSIFCIEYWLCLTLAPQEILVIISACILTFFLPWSLLNHPSWCLSCSEIIWLHWLIQWYYMLYLVLSSAGYGLVADIFHSTKFRSYNLDWKHPRIPTMTPRINMWKYLSGWRILHCFCKVRQTIKD